MYACLHDLKSLAGRILLDPGVIASAGIQTNPSQTLAVGYRSRK